MNESQRNAILELLWDSLTKVPGHPNWRHTGLGNKSEEGLFACIETAMQVKHDGPPIEDSDRTTIICAIRKEYMDLSPLVYKNILFEFSLLSCAEECLLEMNLTRLREMLSKIRQMVL